MNSRQKERDNNQAQDFIKHVQNENLIIRLEQLEEQDFHNILNTYDTLQEIYE